MSFDMNDSCADDGEASTEPSLSAVTDDMIKAMIANALSAAAAASNIATGGKRKQRKAEVGEKASARKTKKPRAAAAAAASVTTAASTTTASSVATSAETPLASFFTSPPQPPLSPSTAAEDDVDIVGFSSLPEAGAIAAKEDDVSTDPNALHEQLLATLAMFEERSRKIEALHAHVAADTETMAHLSTPLMRMHAAVRNGATMSATGVSEAVQRALQYMQRHANAIDVLRRSQDACASEVKRLLRMLMTMSTALLSARHSRVVPGSRAPLINDIYKRVRVNGTLAADVRVRCGDAPLPGALAGAVRLTPNIKTYITFAENAPRGQRIMRSNHVLTLRSCLRRQWSPRDTAVDAAIESALCSAAKLQTFAAAPEARALAVR